MAEVLKTVPETIREDVFHSGKQLRYESGQTTTDQFHRWLCDRYSAEPTLEELSHAASSIFEPMDETIEVARSLHEAGHRLGILSNTCDAHWEYCLAKPYSFLDHWFSVHALSFRLGCSKPDAEIYDKAALLCEVPPENIFFIDDRPENVEGAARAGYDALLFEDAAQLRRELAQRGLLA